MVFVNPVTYRELTMGKLIPYQVLVLRALYHFKTMCIMLDGSFISLPLEVWSSVSKATNL